MSSISTNEKLFNECTLKRGGRFPLEGDAASVQNYKTFRNGLQKMIDDKKSFLNASSTLNRISDVHLDFVNNARINGMAFTYKEKDFVGIPYGTFPILEDLFNRMLARRDILPQIGNVDQEELEIEGLPFLVIDSIVLAELFRSEQLNIKPKPKNKTRREYALLLMNIAIQFLVFHEFAHLQNGHVGLINNLNKKSILEESGSPCPKIISPLFNRTLEMDADASATSNMLHLTLNYFHNPAIIESFGNSFHNIKSAALETLSFAIWGLFRLLDTIQKETNTHSCYPSPLQRRMMCFATISSHFQDSEPDTLIWHNAAEKTVLSSEDGIAKITKSNFGDVERKELINGINDGSYLSEILKEWKENVRPQLLPFARTPLPG